MNAYQIFNRQSKRLVEPPTFVIIDDENGEQHRFNKIQEDKPEDYAGTTFLSFASWLTGNPFSI